MHGALLAIGLLQILVCVTANGSGRPRGRPAQLREMIEEGSQPKAPFEVILVWKFPRFTRKREHAVAFKSMLRRKGVRVVSITEHADDLHRQAHGGHH